jgi:hypothetical protein
MNKSSLRKSELRVGDLAVSKTSGRCCIILHISEYVQTFYGDRAATIYWHDCHMKAASAGIGCFPISALKKFGSDF